MGRARLFSLLGKVNLPYESGDPPRMRVERISPLEVKKESPCLRVEQDLSHLGQASTAFTGRTILPIRGSSGSPRSRSRRNPSLTSQNKESLTPTGRACILWSHPLKHQSHVQKRKLFLFFDKKRLQINEPARAFYIWSTSEEIA